MVELQIGDSIQLSSYVSFTGQRYVLQQCIFRQKTTPCLKFGRYNEQIVFSSLVGYSGDIIRTAG
jgi:hypothetical protein